MDHASAMCAVESLADLRAVLENVRQRERAALEPVASDSPSSSSITR